MDLSEFCESISYMVRDNIQGPQFTAQLYTPKFIENLITTLLNSKNLQSNSYYRGPIPSEYYDAEALKYQTKGADTHPIGPILNFQNWILILQRSIIAYLLLNSKRITWLYGSSPTKPMYGYTKTDRQMETYGGSWYLTISPTSTDQSLDSIFGGDNSARSNPIKRLVIGWIDKEKGKCFDLNFEKPTLYWNINHSQPLPHVHKKVWFFDLPNSKTKHSFLNWSKTPF